MAVKTTVDGQIPYLKTYTPLASVPNSVYTDLLSEMISYNFRKTPTTINYPVGATDNLNFIFSIKNITLNTQIELTYLPIQNNFILCESPIYKKPELNDPIMFTLAATNTKNIYVYLDKEYLDSYSIATVLNTNLNFTVSNIFSNTATVKSAFQTDIAQPALPSTITII